MLKPIIKPVSTAGEGQMIGFMLTPRFSMIAFTSAIEPLRLANRTANRQLYDWQLYSHDGKPAIASNNVEISVNGSFSTAKGLNAAIVCSGLDVQAYNHKELITALRRMSSFGTALGAVCTGSFVLAKAGLLNGYCSTIHWENHSGFVSDFPDLDVTQRLFEIDRNRFTCAGGTAAADMMLCVIARDHGSDLASHVTDMMIHHRIREGAERQRMDLRVRLGVAHPKLLAVVALMEQTIENPMSCAELAEAAGLSTRQLERLFQKYLGRSPTRHYLSIRLEHARYLLKQTSIPILSVALSCGFVSASHFSKSYFEYYSCTPSSDRRGAKMQSTTDAA